MGFTYGQKGGPAMCFNGQKNDVLGWYDDKKVTVTPETNGPWSGKLVGFVDYDKASTSRNEYVLIRVNNLYIQYNLSERFNFQTKEYGNMVTITTVPNDISDSNLLSALSAKQSAIIGNYTIEVCEVVDAISSLPKYMLLSVRLSGQSFACHTEAPVAGAPKLLTPAPAPVLPPSITDSICEDTSPLIKVFTYLGSQRACTYLAYRPFLIPSLCVPGNPAYIACEESCGRCDDHCTEDPQQVVKIDEIHQNQTCRWIAERPNIIAQVCVVSHPAYNLCNETCENCITQSPVSLAPTAAPVTGHPTTVAPTSKAPVTVRPTTVAPTTRAPITASPTMAPLDISPTMATPVEASPTTVAAPVTASPTTATPVTDSPTTTAPFTTTVTPITTRPTTVAPTTVAPTTMAPTTVTPTTVSPTTVAPVTARPTTAAPTTVAPVTDRKSTRLNSSHVSQSRMPSCA